MTELSIRRIGLVLIMSILTFMGGWMASNLGGWTYIIPIIVALILVIINPFWGLLLFVMLIPLESAFLALEGGTATITRILGFIIIGAWVFQSIFTRNKVKVPTNLKVAIVFLSWGFLSVLWAVNQDVTLEKVQTAAQLLTLALLTVNMVDNKNQLKAILIALFIGCLLATILGLMGIGVKTGSDLLTLQNQGAKEYGSYVGIVFLIGSIIFVFEKSKLKFWGLLCIFLSIVALFQVNERGILLAVGIAWVALALITRKKAKTIIFIILFFLMLDNLPFFLAQKGFISDYNAERLTLQDILESGGTGRLEIWGVGGRIFSDNFLVGTGWGNFHVVYNKYADPYEIFTASLSADGKDPHGDLMGVAGELGIIGLILFLVICIGIISQNIKFFYKYKDKESDILVIIVFELLIYIFSMGLTSTFLFRKVYWLILGMGMLLPTLLLTKGIEIVSKLRRRPNLEKI